MGWTNVREESDAAFKDLGLWGFPPNSNYKRGIPDPFTDANDDYAVLEWMRDTYEPDLIEAAFDHDGYGHRWAYEVGNNAKAALIILNNEMTDCIDCTKGD